LPWLAVLGSGSWTVDGLRFPAGVHEVSDEIAERARRSGLRSLVVSDGEQLSVRETPADGPLGLEDLRRGTTGVQLQVPALEPVELPSAELPRNYRCPHCPEPFPSRGALVRHIEFHHEVSLAKPAAGV
jgi:hypothetical protein